MSTKGGHRKKNNQKHTNMLQPTNFRRPFSFKTNTNYKGIFHILKTNPPSIPPRTHPPRRPPDRYAPSVPIHSLGRLEGKLQRLKRRPETGGIFNRTLVTLFGPKRRG